MAVRHEDTSSSVPWVRRCMNAFLDLLTVTGVLTGIGALLFTMSVLDPRTDTDTRLGSATGQPADAVDMVPRPSAGE